MTRSWNAGRDALEQMFEQAKARADICYRANKDTGGLYGTAFVVRDMMAIVDALGEEELNFWGQCTHTCSTSN